jgi:hypothetical protein
MSHHRGDARRGSRDYSTNNRTLARDGPSATYKPTKRKEQRHPSDQNGKGATIENAK